MTINEALVDLINNTQNKFYLYVSNSDENLNQAMNHCLVSIDLGNTTTYSSCFSYSIRRLDDFSRSNLRKKMSFLH
jgi:hypothetical protein